MSRRHALAALSIVAFAACAASANYATARFGLVPVGLGLVATAGTYAAGLALLARDAVQEAAGRRWVLVAVALGGALSWGTSNPRLAFASTLAFVIAELVDFAVYTQFRPRGWGRAAFASNVAGAFVDTIAFLTVAGFPVTIAVVSGQLVGKAFWATVVGLLVAKGVRRVLSRNAVRVASA